MSIRRTVLVMIGILALVGVAFGAGVALGSGSPKPTKPKLQAYAHLRYDGTLMGSLTKNVVAAHRYFRGRYCIELASSIHVTDETFAQLTVDYWNSFSEFTIVMQGASVVCAGQGFPNSILVATDEVQDGFQDSVDASVYVMIP